MINELPLLSKRVNRRTARPRRVGISAKRAPMILVVEDHEDTRGLYRYVLETRGCRVIEARDGEEAVSEAESNHPDIILMDTTLPRVDGLTAMVRIRAHDTMRTVPIIFLSGHAQAQARDAALARGATEYLVKPVMPGDLESAVQRHLRNGLQWKRSETSDGDGRG